MTRQPLWVILCCLPEKGRKEIQDIQEEMKEKDSVVICRFSLTSCIMLHCFCVNVRHCRCNVVLTLLRLTSLFLCTPLK